MRVRMEKGLAGIKFWVAVKSGVKMRFTLTG